jgi:hypothetical protein
VVRSRWLFSLGLYVEINNLVQHFRAEQERRLSSAPCAGLLNEYITLFCLFKQAFFLQWITQIYVTTLAMRVEAKLDLDDLAHKQLLNNPFLVDH